MLHFWWLPKACCGSCSGREGGGLFSEVGKGDGGCCTAVDGSELVAEAGEGEGESSVREELLFARGRGGVKHFVE